MNLVRGFARQLARPRGAVGRLIGRTMDVANRRPTRFALDLLGASAGERVLDAGCGTGATLAALLDEASVQAWGTDPSPTMIAAARNRLGGRASLHQASIEALDLAEGTFDAALALNVLYFEKSDGAMVHALHRLLRPDGRLVVYVTSRKTMENWPFARAGVHRLFDAAELEQALIAGGFAPGRIEVHQRAITGSVEGLLALAVKQG